MSNSIWWSTEALQELAPEVRVAIVSRQVFGHLPLMISFLARAPSKSKPAFLHTLRVSLCLHGRMVRPDLEWPDMSLPNSTGRQFSYAASESMNEDHYEHVATLIPALDDLYSGKLGRFSANLVDRGIFNDPMVPGSIAPLGEQDADVGDVHELARMPLIPKARPDFFEHTFERLHKLRAEHPELRFWCDWLDRVIRGEAMNWDVVQAVARIPEEDWEKGPERIAEVIRGIEAEFYGLDQDALRAHVDTLVAQPELYRDAATSTGNLIEREIARFKAEAPSNSLPIGFEVFEELPPIYSAISVLLSSPDVSEREETVANLQAEINRLQAVINRLRGDLREAQDQLRDARLTRVEAAQMRTFGERLQTTLTNVTLVGTLGMNLLLFLGIEGERMRYEELKNSLDEVTRLMIEAREAPEVNRPEPITDGPKFQKP